MTFYIYIIIKDKKKYLIKKISKQDYIYNMSDNYEYEKSMKPQNTDDYSPYVDKQSNGYINDINNGVYTNNSLTLVNFDLKND